MRAPRGRHAHPAVGPPVRPRVHPRRDLLHDQRGGPPPRARDAYFHCEPGGAALFAPDYVRENFRASSSHGGEDGERRALRYLEWTWDPDPADTTYLVDYAFLLRYEDGSVRGEHDRHVEGLFSREVWLRLLGEVGFAAERIPFAHSDFGAGELEVFVGRRAHR